MSKSANPIELASTAQVAQLSDESERPPGGDVRDAAEALHSQIEVIRAFTELMSNMAESALNCGRPAPAKTDLLVSADAFEIVMNDLTKRCKAAADAALQLGYRQAQ